VQKEFFSKPTEEVTGSTEDVVGTVFVNDNGTVSVFAKIDSQSFLSGNDERDEYVRGQFGQAIEISVDSYELNGGLDEISATVPVVLTINDVSKTINFDFVAIISEDFVDASGSAEISMTEFGVGPASFVGVYEVNEVATISFDIVAMPEAPESEEE